MAGRRGFGRLLRQAGGAVDRRDWIGALGAVAAAHPLLARQWLRLRGAHGPIAAGAAGEGRRAAAAAAVDAAEVALHRARAWAAAIQTYAPDAWDDHVRDHPVPPPPAVPQRAIAILVDARGALPAQLRATLLSLIEQRGAVWTAHVVADEGATDHPVASLAASDPRIRLEGECPDGPVMIVDAGTVLDRRALGWLVHAVARTGAAAAFADEDAMVDDARFGCRRCDPVLRGVHDRDAAVVMPPPLAMLLANGADAAAAVVVQGGIAARRTLLAAAARTTHVPFVLASRLLPSVATRRAPADEAEWREAAPTPAAPAAAASGIEPLRIVMPTRDEAALLIDAAESLLDLAEQTHAIRLVVVDNRSERADTAAALDRLRARGIEIRSHDEPFNWSRINNLAVADAEEPHLLFVNNDTRMLTPGWDRLLSAALARDDVGAVGARLLYPEGAVQHAGVVLGVGRSPVHEGVGAAIDDPGPNGRWRTARAVAAVTGAFMGVRRDAFAQAGGFDETRLAVAYSDVDLCLSLREAGRRVLFEPAIELVHCESRSRGFNVTRSRVAWDEGELASLRARWGDAPDVDPGYNPRWARCERAFDGFRAPGEAETLAWIDRSAAADPWRIERRRRGD